MDGSGGISVRDLDEALHPAAGSGFSTISSFLLDGAVLLDMYKIAVEGAGAGYLMIVRKEVLRLVAMHRKPHLLEGDLEMTAQQRMYSQSLFLFWASNCAMTLEDGLHAVEDDQQQEAIVLALKRAFPTALPDDLQQLYVATHQVEVILDCVLYVCTYVSYR